MDVLQVLGWTYWELCRTSTNSNKVCLNILNATFGYCTVLKKNNMFIKLCVSNYLAVIIFIYSYIITHFVNYNTEGERDSEFRRNPPFLNVDIHKKIF